MNGWISVHFRSPTAEECNKNCGLFLICFKSDNLHYPQSVTISRYCQHHEEKNNYENGWLIIAFELITHWMPLPEPPKELNDPT